MISARKHCDEERNSAQVPALGELIRQGKGPQCNEKDKAKTDEREIPTLAAHIIANTSESDKNQTIETDSGKEKDPGEDVNSHLAWKSPSIHSPGIRKTVFELLLTLSSYIAA
jgi:hypothetical protein